MKNTEFWIEHFEMQRHPEGGYWSSAYRSTEFGNNLPDRFKGERNLWSSIYFLLDQDQHSKWHRLKQDELWHFYSGDPLELHYLDTDGSLNSFVLGPNPALGHQFQVLAPFDCWMAAKSVGGEHGHSLLGCSLAPGFEFKDFEIGRKEQLLELSPSNEDLIDQLA